MAKWCLTAESEKNLRDALREEGNPLKMVTRTSEERLAWFSKYVGPDNAKQINALFESKLLLKNQVQGFKSFVKQMGGPKRVQLDFIGKVNKLTTALSNAEVNQYLGDYVAKKLGLQVTEEEFKTISDLSAKIGDLSKGFDVKNLKWENPGEATLKGATQVILEKYVGEIKSGGSGVIPAVKERLGQYKEEFGKNGIRATGNLVLDSAKALADTSTELVASFDDSLFGRQGIFTLLTGHPLIWGKSCAKSFSDIVRTFGGQKTSEALMAQIYGDPLYMNGEYKKAGIIDQNEEQFPTSWPEKLSEIGRQNLLTKTVTAPLWLFGKGIEASAAAFKNGSLRMRTELYTMMRNAKVSHGIEMTDEQIKGTGTVVNSMLAKGALGRSAQNPIVRLMMWAPRMLKADLDILTAHAFSDIPSADRKTALGNLLKIVAITAIIEAIANKNNPKSTEFDPRSSDFLQLNGSTGFLRGIPQLITLMARLITGQYKNNKGQIINYEPGIGKRSRLDAVYSFLRGKAPPSTGAVYDWLAGSDYNGNPPTLSSSLLQHEVPISIQNLIKVRQTPTIDNALGAVSDFFGLNSNLNPKPNIQSGMIPEKQPVKNADFIEVVKTYAEAMKTDPETAFNRMFTGQKIVRVTNGTVMVERMPLSGSQAVKKAAGANNPQMKLDHTVPLELGGSNDNSNLKLVTTSTWSSYTPVENALGKALKNGRIDKNTAQKLITDFKSGKLSKDQVLAKIK